MAGLFVAYPALEGHEESVCEHECAHGIDGNTLYTDQEHILLTAFGGRRGYVATIINEPGEIKPWVEEALAQGWTRFEIDGCGYGDPLPNEVLDQFRKELAKVVEEVKDANH